MKILFESFFTIKCILIRLQSKISLLALFNSKSNIAKTSRVSRFSVLRDVTIGDYSFLAANCDLINCKIGKFCSISKNVTIGAAIHPTNFISTSPIFYRHNNALKIKWVTDLLFADESPFTNLGNDVWIGMNSTILGGITIGDGAIIAAHSIVTKDVPPYAIVGGVPAKIIRYRFQDEMIHRLLTLQWWNNDIRNLKSNLEIFSRTLDSDTICKLNNINS